MTDLRKAIRSRLTPKPEIEAEGLRKRKAKSKKTIIPSSGSADQRNTAEVQLTVTEQDLSALPDPSSSTRDRRLTFTLLISRVWLLCAKTREIQWRFWSSGVRKALSSDVSLFVLTSSTFLLSPTLASVSFIKHEPGWMGASQAILYLFQAYCAFSSRRKAPTASRAVENLHSESLDQARNHLSRCLAVAALFAVISALTYPLSSVASAVFSFLANISQVLGVISIRIVASDS